MMKIKDILKKFNHRPNLPTSTKLGFDILKKVDKESYLIKKGDANKINADIVVTINTLIECKEYVPQGLKNQIDNRFVRLDQSMKILINLK